MFNTLHDHVYNREAGRVLLIIEGHFDMKYGSSVS